MSHFEEHKARILAEAPYNFTQDSNGDELNTGLMYVNNNGIDYRTTLTRVARIIQRARKDQGLLLVQTAINKLEEMVRENQRYRLTHQPEEHVRINSPPASPTNDCPMNDEQAPIATAD